MFSVWGISGIILFSFIWLKKWNTAWRGHDFVDAFIPELGHVLKCSNAMPSI